MREFDRYCNVFDWMTDRDAKVHTRESCLNGTVDNSQLDYLWQIWEFTARSLIEYR